MNSSDEPIKKLSLINFIKNNIFKFLLLISLIFMIYSIYNLVYSLNNIGIKDLNQNMEIIAFRLSKLEEVNQQLLVLNKNFKKINMTLLTNTFSFILNNFKQIEKILKNPVVMSGNMYNTDPNINQNLESNTIDNYIGYYNGKLRFSI